MTKRNQKHDNYEEHQNHNDQEEHFVPIDFLNCTNIW